MEDQTSPEVKPEESRAKSGAPSHHLQVPNSSSSWLLLELLVSWPSGSVRELQHGRRKGAGWEQRGEGKSEPRRGLFLAAFPS